MNRILANYKNGNTLITLYEDGTREMVTEDDEFNLEFPISLDINLTQKCSAGCPFCYASCTPDGEHGDIMGAKFIESLPRGIECALQVNDLTHPDLILFLNKLKSGGIIPSITVNQIHFEQKEDLIADLIEKKLIYGLGISLKNSSDEFINRVKKYQNAVIHTVAAIHTPRDYVKLINKDLKVLILGYKYKGRGVKFCNENQNIINYNFNWLRENVDVMIKYNWYKVLSFDNLALYQLGIKKLLTDEQWAEFYQGDDGQISMFVDLVDKTFGKSSVVPKNEMVPLKDDIREMFRVVKEMS